jgi:hypothetical protein
VFYEGLFLQQWEVQQQLPPNLTGNPTRWLDEDEEDLDAEECAAEEVPAKEAAVEQDGSTVVTAGPRAAAEKSPPAAGVVTRAAAQKALQGTARVEGESASSGEPAAGGKEVDDSSAAASTRQASPGRFSQLLQAQEQQVAGLAAAVQDGIPQSYREAVEGPEKEQWQRSLQEHYDGLMHRGTWELVPREEAQVQQKILHGKWIFVKKTAADGSLARYKSRFVVKGYEQVEGLDYKETFSPVARYTTFRLFLTQVLKQKRVLKQVDVKDAFLYADVDVDIYCEQPEGFEDGSNRVCKLKKSLFGLKQAPRLWHKHVDGVLKDLGFVQSLSDEALYLKGSSWILLYVDDILVSDETEGQVAAVIAGLQARYTLTVSDQVTQFLGLNVSVKEDRILISAEKYIGKLEARYGTFHPWWTPHFYTEKADRDEKCSQEEKLLYQQKVGSLMYAASTSRCDIAYIVSILAGKLVQPTLGNMEEADRVLGYLQGTRSLGMVFQASAEGLVGYCDSDFAGDETDRRSRTGYVFTHSGGPVVWMTRKQDLVAASSAEAEYIAANEALKEGLYLVKVLADLGEVQQGPLKLLVDNQSAITMAGKEGFQKRTKHMDLKFHFLKDRVSKGEVVLDYIPTEQQAADFLTKRVTRGIFNNCRDLSGIQEVKGSVEK